MSKKRRLNLFLLSLSLTLTVPEGLGEINSAKKLRAKRSLKTYNNEASEYLNSYNSSDSMHSSESEATKRSSSANTYYFETIPKSNGPHCNYFGGKMVCNNGGGASPGGGEMDPYTGAASFSYGVPIAMAPGGWGHQFGVRQSTGLSQDDGSGIGGGGLGGLLELAGLLGLLGLKGLKGLAPLPLLLPLLPLLPILLPLLLLPLLLPLLLLLFVPIPVISGRSGFSLDTSMATISGKIAEFATGILESDQCVERVSCEIARVGKTFQFDNGIHKFTKNMSSDSILKIKVKKGLTYFEDKDNQRKSCAKFTCNSIGLNKSRFKQL